MNQEQPYEYQYEYTYQPNPAPSGTTNQASAPAPAATDKANEKKANILCFISLGCEILPALIFGMILTIISQVTDGQPSAGLDIITNVLAILNILFVIAGLVLMIYVRVKYPRNVFGKVLMWLFILMLIVTVLLFIFYMAFLFIACISCMNCMSGIS